MQQQKKKQHTQKIKAFDSLLPNFANQSLLSAAQKFQPVFSRQISYNTKNPKIKNIILALQRKLH